MCITLGYKAKLEWTENFVPGAVMTPLSIEDLSTMNLGHTCKNRKEARATKKNVTRSRNPAVRPPAPSSSSATSQPTTSHGHTQSSPSNQPYSPPILSPNNSIFFKSVAPSAKDPTPAQSSSLHAVPQRFTKVTNWKAMKTFQYELMRKGMVKHAAVGGGDGGLVAEEIDLTKLRKQERELLMESILKGDEEDNDSFLLRFRERIDR
nr:Pleiotropic drug resistance protein 2 [Ipomoea batatas]